MILKTLGILFLLLLSFLFFVAIRFYFFARTGMKEAARVAAIEEALQLPTISLQRNDELSLRNPDEIGQLRAEVEENGATFCGGFDVPAADARLFGYCLQDPPVYIVVYDHDAVEPWVDVLLPLSGERSFLASTLPEIGRGAPRHPDDEAEYFAAGTVVSVLIRTVAERSSQDSAEGVSKDRFVATFERAAQRSQEYIQTASVDQQWLETIAADAGVELSGREAEMLSSSRQYEQAEKVESQCLASLAESGGFSAAEWEALREDLVVVWDEMPGNYAASAFAMSADTPASLEDALDELEDQEGNMRARVSELNLAMPADARIEHVGSVSSPVAADIYRVKHIVD